MDYALYLNGVFEVGLREILGVHSSEPDRTCYLQPHGADEIKKLREEPPSLTNPVKIYISTTTNLTHISYCAEIIGWENKSSISDSRIKGLNDHIRQYQPEEGSIYMEINGKTPVNLISVINLRRLEVRMPVGKLKKVDNGGNLGVRTQPGGYSYVVPLEIEQSVDSELNTISLTELNNQLEDGIKESKDLTSAERAKRVAAQNTLPERISIISTGFRRNPDVVVEVLNRAEGLCEECFKPGPFKKRSNGEPYLEVHHKVWLSQGGEDTVENAIALCPNCHRKMHFG